MAKKKLQGDYIGGGQAGSRLSYLQKLGVVLGDDVEAVPHKSMRFTLTQIDPEFARIFVQPGSGVTALLPAKFVVREAGLMVTKIEVIPSWDEWPLELDNLHNDRVLFEEITRTLEKFPPLILNDYLAGRAAPLGCCQTEGVIIATGYSNVPAGLAEESPLTLKLWLRDERGHDSCHVFTARIDRSVLLRQERLRGRNFPADRPPEGTLFEKIGPEDETWNHPYRRGR